MMMASVLLKTFGTMLLSLHPAAAVICWIIGLFADVCWTRGSGRLRSQRIRDIALLQAATLLIAVALTAFHLEATMRWKDGLPLIAQATALIIQALGFSIGAFDGILHATTMAGVLEFPVDLDSLGILSPMLFAGFSLVFLLASSPCWPTIARGVAWIAGVVVGAMILRWILATLLFLFITDFIGYETEELPVLPFFKSGLKVALYLPFLLVGAVILQGRLGGLASPDDGNRRGCAPKHPLLCVIILILLVVVMWQPAGSRKDGEILINTYHTQWSRTDREYDKSWFGAGAGYNYAEMKRLFEQFYPTRELKTRITPEDLANTSILVIYDPDRAFTGEEIRAVHEFVKGGGGIFLIGDHTNVFGGTSHMNTICHPFGFIFRDDVLFDLDEDFFQLYDVPCTYSQFLHGIDFFKFRGPASIQPTSLFARTIFRVSHAKSLRAIYSVNNFYPPPHDDPKMRTGEFSVSVMSRYGKGRVLAFADSTIFSNFEIFYPGKYEYLLNSMRWLNYADSPLTTPLKRIALVGAIILLGIQVGRCGHPRRLLGTLLGGFVTGALAWAICLWSEQAQAEFPKPTQPLDALFFATTQDDDPYTLRTFVTEAPYDQKYDVFIQWVLRSNVFSGFYLHGQQHDNALYKMLRDSDQARTGLGLIVRQPEHLDLLKELGPGPLSETNHLLLMVSVSTNITQGEVMASIEESAILKDPAMLAQVEAAWPSGEIRLEDGGRRIAVVFPAEKFADTNMGFSEKVSPSDTQRERFQEQFALIDWLFDLGGDSPSESGPPEEPEGDLITP